MLIDVQGARVVAIEVPMTKRCFSCLSSDYSAAFRCSFSKSRVFLRSRKSESKSRTCSHCEIDIRHVDISSLMLIDLQYIVTSNHAMSSTRKKRKCTPFIETI